MTNIESIVSEINQRAKTHPVGKLHEIRKNLPGHRISSKYIFDSRTIKDLYAFHFGGRKELQFNIGVEDDKLRYGVAFSLETSRSLPKINVLFPKIKRFNDFIQSYPEEYLDMRMWHYKDGVRSSDYMPTSIPHELVTKGVFIFLGKRQSLTLLDYECILNIFDRLLPLYEYVENNGNLQLPLEAPFEFQPGCTTKKPSAKVTQAQKEIDMNLRHNALQEALWSKLSKKYGDKNVGTENQSGTGSIDLVVHQNSEYWFYEIKTAYSPRVCIREAIGQLLEYAFWPGMQTVTRLIVVGEGALDKGGEKYLCTLRNRFSLPIEYEQIAI